MSATDYRKMILVQNDTRMFGVECTDGVTVRFFIEGLAGYGPHLSTEDVDKLIDALVETKQVMQQ